MLTDSYPVLQVRSNSLILYVHTDYYSQYGSPSLLKKLESLSEARKTAYSGEIKEGTKKRLTRAIDLLVQTAKVRRQWNPITEKYVKHRLSYITLTVSQSENITARVAYDKLLKHFLQWFRRTMKVRTYIWKAEQQTRGQIHYHITTPSWVHYQEIRDKWNSLQRSAGMLEEYAMKSGHYDPNSTDIGEVRHVKNLSGYLLKEFCKAIQNPNTKGKVWDCSENLKGSKYFTFGISNHQGSTLIELIDQKKVTTLALDQCTVIKAKPEILQQVMSLKDIQNYESHMQAIRTKERKQQPEPMKEIDLREFSAIIQKRQPKSVQNILEFES